jgi:hypothetical protein
MAGAAGGGFAPSSQDPTIPAEGPGSHASEQPLHRVFYVAIGSRYVWFLVYLLGDAGARAIIAHLGLPSVLEGRVYFHLHPATQWSW